MENSDSEMDDGNISATDDLNSPEKEHISKYKRLKGGNCEQRSPIVSPLRLDLEKSPIENENMCMEHENNNINHEDDIETASTTSNSLSSLIRKPKKSKIILESDDASSSSSDIIENNKKISQNSSFKKKANRKIINSDDDTVCEENENANESFMSIGKSDSDSDELYEKTKTLTNSDKKKNTNRHSLRPIMDDTELKPETSIAMMIENERLKRLNLNKNKKLSPEKKETDLEDDLFIIKTIDGERTELYLDTAQLLGVSNKISRHLKEHQIQGITFMFESCFESLEEIKNGSEGSGCVLAHCMGLG